MSVSVRRAQQSQATHQLASAVTPMGQAPTPPPAANWAKKTIEVTKLQAIQENRWGRIRPPAIDRM